MKRKTIIRAAAGLTAASLLATGLLLGQSISIQISIPQGIAGDVVDAFSWRFDYDRNRELLSGTPEEDPVYETRVAFAKRQVRDQIAQTYTSYMQEQAARESGAAAAVAAHTASLDITVQ